MPVALAVARSFPTRTVLCVTTLHVPDAQLMLDVYQLLEFMTGGNVSTATLSRAMKEVNRFLLHRDPRLGLGWANTPKDRDAMLAWFVQRETALGPTLELAPN